MLPWVFSYQKLLFLSVTKAQQFQKCTLFVFVIYFPPIVSELNELSYVI